MKRGPFVVFFFLSLTLAFPSPCALLTTWIPFYKCQLKRIQYNVLYYTSWCVIKRTSSEKTLITACSSPPCDAHGCPSVWPDHRRIKPQTFWPVTRGNIIIMHNKWNIVIVIIIILQYNNTDSNNNAQLS